MCTYSTRITIYTYTRVLGINIAILRYWVLQHCKIHGIPELVSIYCNTRVYRYCNTHRYTCIRVLLAWCDASHLRAWDTIPQLLAFSHGLPLRMGHWRCYGRTMRIRNTVVQWTGMVSFVRKETNGCLFLVNNRTCLVGRLLTNKNCWHGNFPLPIRFLSGAHILL